MSKNKTKNGFDIGRPPLKIDENLVKSLASVGCSDQSIALQVGCSVDTLHNRFSDLIDKSREGLKRNLRIWQLEAARKGQVAMLIWLGKQMLDQSDRTIVELKKIPDDVLIQEAQRRLLDEPKE